MSFYQQQQPIARRRLLAMAGASAAAALIASPAGKAAAHAPTAVVTDFGADPTGNEHAGEAFQACIDFLPESGGTVIVPPGTYRLAGHKVVELRSNIDIIGHDATIVRPVREGSYVAFAGLSYGKQGWASGVTNVTMRGLTFRGAFRESGQSSTICVMALHHAANIRIEECEFIEIQGGAGHTFDLCGCENITFTDCVWRGYNVVPTHAPTIETIQLDISHSTTVSYPDEPGSYDALGARNVTIERCKFLPLTRDGETFPAPNPVGEHFAQDQQPYSGLVMRDVEIVDPASDPRPANNGDNADARGLIHVRQAQDMLLENLTVRSTTGQVSNRVVMLSSMSYGRLISDANVPGSRGFYDEPMRCSNITIRNLVVEGFTSAPGEDPAQNPIIFINGVDDGAAEHIDIDATIRGDGAAAVMITKADHVKLKLAVSGYRQGVDMSESTHVRINNGTFSNVDSPITMSNVHRFGVTAARGSHETAQPTAVTLDATSDHGVIAGTRWTGYHSVVDGGGPNVVERGNKTTS